MKKLLFSLIGVLVFSFSAGATTYLPISKEEAIKLGFVKEVNLQNTVEQLIGPQICFWHKTKDKDPGFILIFGSDPSKDGMVRCIKVDPSQKSSASNLPMVSSF